MYNKTPHTKMPHFLKVRYKCYILPHGKETKSIDFVMGSRQGNHGFDTLTSQIICFYLH